MTLPFPQAVLDQHLVMLGKTGSGKSSKLRVIVENLMRRNKRVCVVDPKGDWWGVKLGADGKSPGLPMILFGDFKKEGVHDVPINDRSGKHVAELVSTGNRPCVIGFSGWTQAAMTRFWIDFASMVFALNRGELYLGVDEFHNFAPKGKILSPEAGQSLHWSNRMLSEGRGLGIVCLTASQRPQKVHNDSLTSHETLVALRVVHAADRAAIKDWIDGNGDPSVGKEVLSSLASMERTDGWVWSPEVGFGPKQVAWPMFETFDSFAPPQLQKRVSDKGWADVDLAAVQEKLAAVIEEAKANDPKALRKRIADLEKQLKARPTESKVETKEVRVEVPVLKNGQLDKALSLVERLARFVDDARGVFEPLATAIGKASTVPPPVSTKPQPFRTPSPVSRTVQSRPRTPPAETSDANGFTPSAVQQRILDAVAWYESLGNHSPTLIQVGAVALIDPTGGYFSNVVGPLSNGGLIERGGGVIRLTGAGRSLASIPETVGTLADYHNVLRERIRKMKSASGKSIEILDAIIEAGGESLTNEQVGEAVSVDHTGGYFSNCIGPLSTAGVITRRGGVVMPTEVLFPDGLE